jgi:predicted nuclease of predicted toxin-antitoxin system
MDAADSELMRFAADHGYVIMTHDLDFGAMIAAANQCGPA